MSASVEPIEGNHEDGLNILHSMGFFHHLSTEDSCMKQEPKTIHTRSYRWQPFLAAMVAFACFTLAPYYHSFNAPEDRPTKLVLLQEKSLCMPTAKAYVQRVMMDASQCSSRDCSLLFVGGQHPDSDDSCLPLISSLVVDALSSYVSELQGNALPKISSVTVYGHILQDTHPMLLFLQSMKGLGHADEPSEWPLSTFITSLQKACVQLHSESSRLHQKLDAVLKSDGKITVLLEDMLVPDSLCKQMLSDVGSATLGSMLR
jgi:hypothetical protein